MTDKPTMTPHNGNQYWKLNHQLHRLDGPAIIFKDGSVDWYKHGKLHRIDGPAYIGENGYHAWYVDGKPITPEVDTWMKEQTVSWPWDEETQMLFVMKFL